MTIESIYDAGNVFPSAVLDISDEDLVGHYASALTTIASIGLALNYPVTAAVPHLIVNGYKDLLAVGITIEDYSFPALDKVKEILADPSKFAAAATDAPAAEAKEEEDEESDGDMGF